MASRRRPKKKAYHHGDLRRAILDAALALIRTEGLSRLSLRECARRAGVSHAAPYRHFKDKNELLLAIAAEGFEKLAASGKAAMEGITDPVRRMDAYGMAYVRCAFEHPEHHRVMFTADLAWEGPEEQSPGARAFRLLVDSASAAAAPGVDPMFSALSRWALPHGLSMLILDGRVPKEKVGTAKEAEALAGAVFAHWRSDPAAVRKKKST